MKICSLCKNKNTRYFHALNSYQYYRCLQCFTLFLHPVPNRQILEKFYEDAFDYSAGFQGEQRIRRRTGVIYRNLKKINPQGTSLLDIGSGYGFLLDEMNKLGLATEGIEPSTRLYSYSRKTFHLKVKKTTFEDFSPNKRFDYITLIHVIEHVKEPVKFINRILKLLNPGGVLFIETPNLDSHLFTAEQKNYTFLLAPDHLWIFSKYSFDYFLQNIKKVKLSKVSTYTNAEHFMSVFKHFFNRTERKKPNKNSMSSKNVVAETSFIKKSKIVIFDTFLARLCTGLLNFKNKGSTLEIYLKKE